MLQAICTDTVSWCIVRSKGGGPGCGGGAGGMFKVDEE